MLSQIESAVSIPTEALIPEMEGEKVFIMKKKAVERKVQPGCVPNRTFR
jgi:membrane fusion protein, multidrug efflux system